VYFSKSLLSISIIHRLPANYNKPGTCLPAFFLFNPSG